MALCSGLSFAIDCIRWYLPVFTVTLSSYAQLHLCLSGSLVFSIITDKLALPHIFSCSGTMGWLFSLSSAWLVTTPFQEVPKDQAEEDMVGRPLPHLASAMQASGEAVYCDDIPRYDNELYLRLVTSTRAHAKIKWVRHMHWGTRILEIPAEYGTHRWGCVSEPPNLEGRGSLYTTACKVVGEARLSGPWWLRCQEDGCKENLNGCMGRWMINNSLLKCLCWVDWSFLLDMSNGHVSSGGLESTTTSTITTFTTTITTVAIATAITMTSIMMVTTIVTLPNYYSHYP